MNNKRVVGIDLLKIISMSMIIIIHITGQGGILESAYLIEKSDDAYWAISIFRAFCFCGVNCFAVVSGYVSLHSKHIYSNICVDYLRVLLYSVGITLLFHFVYPGSTDTMTWKRAVFPVTHNQYWYFTSYFGVGIILPLLNKGIQALSQKILLLIIGMLYLLFSVFPMIFGKEYFALNDGYSMLWLMFMYIIGAYISVREKNSKIHINKNWFFAIYFMSASVAFALSWLVETQRIYSDAYLQIGYTNPFMVICAIALLFIFKEVKVPALFEKIIAFFAPLTFSVYLIHTHPLVLSYIVSGSFSFLAERNIVVMCGSVLVSALLIYILVSLLDFPRHIIERKMGVKRKIRELENRIMM